jgi:fucokinase
MSSAASPSFYWDYLIITASHSAQAEAYESQLELRRSLGLISGVGRILVVPDPGGKRVGSGGSTLHCLLTILNEEQARTGSRYPAKKDWEAVLRDLRVLIIHAGGDSKRLPPYGPCGKIFVPVPGETDRALGLTLLDRQLPTYLALPPTPGQGQVVIATGDVLLDFNPSSLRFSFPGITGVGCFADPRLARHHGVYSADSDGRVKRFYQKPSPRKQKSEGAINRHGQSILDIGIMNLDERAASALLSLCEPIPNPQGQLVWSGESARAIESSGLDFFLEVGCALGTEATPERYVQTLKETGSHWPETLRRSLFDGLSPIPFRVEILHQCGFLHFGTLRQLIQSGSDLMSMDYGVSHGDSRLEINNIVEEKGRLKGPRGWVEGCRIRAGLTLEGMNVLTGVDVDEDLTVPEGLCLDVLKGRNRKGKRVWFVRPVGVDDLFNGGAADEGTLCNMPLKEWMGRMGTDPQEIWPDQEEALRTIWEGHFFPAVKTSADYRKWLWMYRPESGTPEQKAAWKAADRFSLAEIAVLADQEYFHKRRQENRADWIRGNLRLIFRSGSGFSAGELAFLMGAAGSTGFQKWCLALLKETYRYFGPEQPLPTMERFELSRIFHSLGRALLALEESWGREREPVRLLLGSLKPEERSWLRDFGIDGETDPTPYSLALSLKEAAFVNMGRLIVWSKKGKGKHPKNALRSDEIVWGRAPARLDLAGGWSDTPPYSLEHGGAVLNAAVDLNSQPPIHAYARVIAQPEIRISSIDHGTRLIIHTLDELCDYREPTSQFGLAKAALVLSGFSPQTSLWPEGTGSLDSMLDAFGGGLEITTLAAIPSGSGLGTSSIMGAVLLSVIARVTGREPSPRELFNLVLQLEQELTTGGGWQDQIGGAVEGVKIIRTDPGLIPDPKIHFIPPEVLEPGKNGGRTLLFYTGLRRLAKNILGEVVGRYLDRDRIAMATLRQIHGFPPRMGEAMSARDIDAFGELLGTAWELKKAIDPDSTTDEIEAILGRVKPHIFGATLLGAGAGGFLLMVCRSEGDAGRIKKDLSENPPNDRARFFDYSVSREGLKLTVC